MRFFIESVSGKKGYKSFKDLNEYVDFMTKKGHLIKTLKEADLPYSDKPVKLPSVSKSNGWSEITDFGDIDREAEKAASVIASSNGSVMKDEASMEVSSSKEVKDKSEMGLGKEKGDVEMADFKEFKYEEPEIKSSKSKTSDKKEDEEDNDKEEKKEEIKEAFKDYLPRAGFIRNDDEDKSSKKIGLWGGQGSDEQLAKAKIIAKVKFANGDRMGRVTKDDLEHFDEYKEQYDEIYGLNEEDIEIEECWKNAGVKQLDEDRGEYNKFNPELANMVKPDVRNKIGMKYHYWKDDLGNRFNSVFDALEKLEDRMEFDSPEYNELKELIQKFAAFKKKVIYKSDDVATDLSNPNSWRTKRRKN